MNFKSEFAAPHIDQTLYDGGQRAFEMTKRIASKLNNSSHFFPRLAFVKLMKATWVTGVSEREWEACLACLAPSLKDGYWRCEASWVSVGRRILGTVKEVSLPNPYPVWLFELDASVTPKTSRSYISVFWENLLPLYSEPFESVALKSLALAKLGQDEVSATQAFKGIKDKALREVMEAVKRHMAI